MVVAVGLLVACSDDDPTVDTTTTTSSTTTTEAGDTTSSVPAVEATLDSVELTTVEVGQLDEPDRARRPGPAPPTCTSPRRAAASG